MITVKEGEKRFIRALARRLTGSGAITLTSPQRRILDANRTLVTGFDWGTATWDGTANEISALFDSTATGLTAAATYYMQLRGTIGSEIYAIEVTVRVAEWGP